MIKVVPRPEFIRVYGSIWKGINLPDMGKKLSILGNLHQKTGDQEIGNQAEVI